MVKKAAGIILVILLLALQPAACAAVRPEGSFRIGGGGKDSPTCAPLVLPNGDLVVAVSTQGGLGGEPLDTDGEYKTYLACLDYEQNVVWQSVWTGTVSLYGLDENGGVQAFWRYKDGGETYVRFTTLSADTGEQTAQKQPMKLVSTQTGADPHIYSQALPDYGFVTEIHDPEATTEPRYFSLCAPDGEELWRKNQKELVVQNVEEIAQLDDGILLLGSSGELSEDVYYLPIVVKVSLTGELLWQYIPSEMESGSLLHFQRGGEGDVVVFGYGRIGELTADASTWQIIASLDEKSGEVRWEKEYRDTETRVSGRSDVVAVPEGYAAVCFNADTQAFSCRRFGTAGELLDGWSVSAPGFIYYRSPLPFYWQGELWVQATADNDYRWDAHYQRVDPASDAGS